MIIQFPYFISRIASFPIGYIKELECEDTYHSIEELNILFLKLERISQILDSELFKQISILTDKTSRGSLLSLRRKIRKLKQVTFSDEIIHIVGQSIYTSLKQYSCLVDEFQTVHGQQKILFTNQVKSISSKTMLLSNNNLMLNGLLLSNDTLFENICEYQEHQEVSMKTVLTALKYLMRIVYKTSPFSSFTSIIEGRVEEQCSDLSYIRYYEGSPSDKIDSYMQFNGVLYVLIKNICLSLESVKEHLPLSLNSSIYKDTNYIHFFYGFINGEIIKTMNNHYVIESIIEYFKHNGNRRYLSELNTFLTDSLQYPANDTKRFIDELSISGILEYELPFSSKNYLWPELLSEMLAKLSKEDYFIKNFSDLWRKMVMILRKYSVENPIERRLSIKELKVIFTELNAKLFANTNLNISSFFPVKEKGNEEYSHDMLNTEKSNREMFLDFFKDHSIVYEDTIKNGHLICNKMITNNISITIYDFFSINFKLQIVSENSIRVLAFLFKELKEANPVSLVALYNEYMKSKDSNDQYYSNFIDLYNKEYDQALDSISERLQTTVIHNTKDSIQINPQLLANIVNEYSLPLINSFKMPKSVSAYIQIENNVVPNESPLFTINALMLGYGKAYGRFLHMTSSAFYEALFGSNTKKQCQGDTICSINDPSFFSADMHPPLVDLEIKTPHSESSANKKSSSININEIGLKKTAHDLFQFVDMRDGQLLNPLNLGLQASDTRSSLFQFISNICVRSVYSSSGLFQALNKTLMKEQVQFITFLGDSFSSPRIYFGTSLLIQRATWYFDYKNSDQSASELTDFAFYRKMVNLKRELNLPVDVFVTLKAPSNFTLETSNRSFHKPFFLSFRNLLTIIALKNILSNDIEKIIFQEMFPDSQHLLSINTGYHVTEHVIQVCQND